MGIKKYWLMAWVNNVGQAIKLYFFMNDFLILTMTDAGRLSVLNYVKSGFDLQLSHIGLGSANYNHSKDTPGMVQKWADFPLISGFVDEENNCLILTAMGQVNDVIKVSEIGLYSATGQLIGIVAKPTGYFFQTEPGAFFTLGVSISLGQIPGQKLKLSFAPQEQLLMALMNLHLQHKNPHPQYRQYMAELIKLHLVSADPHDYILKTELNSKIKQYLDFLNRLTLLFLDFFGKSMYMGRINYRAAAQNIGFPDNNSDLQDSGYGIFVTPEVKHENWLIKRTAKNFNLSVFDRALQAASNYSGHVNWLILTDVSGSPIADISLPELIKTGLVQSSAAGIVAIDRDISETTPLNKLVLLVCPQDKHEGWRVGRANNKLTINTFVRSGINRTLYSGTLNYALLKPKDGTDLTPPAFFPCLLMSGVSELSGGYLHIDRPAGQAWDFTDQNLVIQVSPDGSHEGWTITRTENRITVYVYERTGETTGPAAGLLNFAIFQNEGESDLYRAGTYEITIPANSMAEVYLVGAGGSGAGSLWSSKFITEWKIMDPGEDSSFTIGDDLNIIAGGGGGGRRGSWNNGSAYRQGVPGEGGQPNVVKIGQAEILEQVPGVKAYLETWSDGCNRDTRGGDAVWLYGAGGEGGYTVETRKHRCYGGGGGSGAMVHFTYKNTSNTPIKATLVVGNHGQPDTIANELNNGKIGEEGVASVKISKLK